MGILNYYNGFGIEPKNTYISAGSDFFIPNIDSTNTEISSRAEEAFKKSYNISDDDIMELKVMFSEYIKPEIMTKHWHNILHLYLALQSSNLEEIRMNNGNINQHYIEDICYFCDNYLVFDNNGIPGICVETLDHLFINSGIKVALNQNECGLYVNKSGMGNKGWDVRACLVDEDYAGYVHLSCAYTMSTIKTKPRTVYCGDKITQMMVFEVHHNQWQSVSEDEYNKLMSNSDRGSNGFGSSDVIH